jgi:hypothetical protein
MTYIGVRGRHGRCFVRVHDEANDKDLGELPPRRDLYNHSPDGFEWGYSGSGPAQLALALLAHHLGDDARALELHQDFKSFVVAHLPLRSWELTGEKIDAEISLVEASRRGEVPY